MIEQHVPKGLTVWAKVYYRRSKYFLMKIVLIIIESKKDEESLWIVLFGQVQTLLEEEIQQPINKELC
jgi:hypothetical protein